MGTHLSSEPGEVKAVRERSGLSLSYIIAGSSYHSSSHFPMGPLGYGRNSPEFSDTGMRWPAGIYSEFEVKLNRIPNTLRLHLVFFLPKKRSNLKIWMTSGAMVVSC